MYDIAAARQLYRKIEWNPADMPSSTQITSGNVQHAQQQDARSTDSQETHTKSLPRTGNQDEHRGLYPKTRPTWTKAVKANSKKQADADTGTDPADAAKLAESGDLPQAEEHIAATRNPPAHIQLLNTEDQETYTNSWNKLPAVPKQVKSPEEYINIRTAAMEHIGTLQDLDAKCMGILQSRLAATEPSEGRDKLNTLEKQITQSKTELDGLWIAFQKSALYGMPPVKAASAA